MEKRIDPFIFYIGVFSVFLVALFTYKEVSSEISLTFELVIALIILIRWIKDKEFKMKYFFLFLIVLRLTSFPVFKVLKEPIHDKYYYLMFIAVGILSSFIQGYFYELLRKNHV